MFKKKNQTAFKHILIQHHQELRSLLQRAFKKSPIENGPLFGFILKYREYLNKPRPRDLSKVYIDYFKRPNI